MPENTPCACKLLARQIAEELAAKLRPPPATVERLISPDEAAKLLNCSRTTLDRQRRTLPFILPRVSGRGYDVVYSKLLEHIRRAVPLLACWTVAF